MALGTKIGSNMHGWWLSGVLIPTGGSVLLRTIGIISTKHVLLLLV